MSESEKPAHIKPVLNQWHIAESETSISQEDGDHLHSIQIYERDKSVFNGALRIDEAI